MTGAALTEPASNKALIDAAIPRAALVTGGARRIGRAVAVALADAGFAVAVHCNDSEDEARATAASLPTRAAVLRADLSREDETASLVAQATAALGPIGVLVNNASRFERDEWDSVTRESWDAHLLTNLRAPFVLMQTFAAALPPDARGVVVNLLDQRVWSPTPHFVSYSLSKAALWALTQSMALALAPRVRVNGVGPGPTVASARQSAEQFAKQSGSVPLGHGSSPGEVARGVLAILSLPSMTGQMLALDGGQHLQWSPAGQGGSDPE